VKEVHIIVWMEKGHSRRRMVMEKRSWKGEEREGRGRRLGMVMGWFG
jgi:hypothetical protein